MYKTFLKILGILLLAIFQLAFFNKLEILGSLPNIILIVSLALMLRGNQQESFQVGILGGVLLDIASPLRFGLYTLLFMAILIFINFVILRLLPTPNIVFAYLIFFLSFIFLNFIIALTFGIFAWWQILIDALLNGFWGILIYYLIGRSIKIPKEEVKVT